jgi:hypothetical protein
MMLEDTIELQTSINAPYLIQHLEQPQGRDNPFAFGGGLLNGGFTPEAFALLKPIFSFTYMGAAEFEFGALPTTFHFLYSQARNPTGQGLVTGEIKFTGKSRAKRYLEIKGKSVYYICPTSYETQVREYITSMAIDNCVYHMKSYTGLHYTLAGITSKSCGWIEIRSGYMFFTDYTMYTKTKQLFGLEG